MRQTTWLVIWLWLSAVLSFFQSEDRHAVTFALLAVAGTIYCLIRKDAPDTPKKRDGNTYIEDAGAVADSSSTSDSSGTAM